MKSFQQILTFSILAVLLLWPTSLHARPKVVAYLPNWLDLEAFSETIDYPKITHINIAFENPVAESGELSFNPQNEVILTQARAAGVKVLVSIGGGATSSDGLLKTRYFTLLADERRPAFVEHLADYVTTHGFDGLDVDLEGVTINEHYGDFIAELSAALKPRGKLLTAALSKGNGSHRVPDSALAHLDFLNIMAYDATGPWSPEVHGQHSSLEFARSSVDHWIRRGLPKAKAVLGVPFYGYGFGEAFKKGGYAYAKIVAANPAAAQSDETGSTIWYNGLPTIRAKAQYVIDQELGGIMIWALSYDAEGDLSLLTAIDSVLRPTVAK